MGGLFWWIFGLQSADVSNKEKIYFVVNKGDGVSEITNRLEKAGMIRNSLHFKILTLVLGTSKKLKAGGYYLSASMKPEGIAQMLTKGVDDQWITIIEGLRSEEIGELLIKKGFAINPEEWVKTIKNSKLEGKLFPDSYLLPRGANQGTILKIIQKNFQKKVVAGQKDSVLILASLVEREAKTKADKEIVAGILLKRISDGWPLQVDATVQYAVASKKCSILKSPCDWWPHNLTKENLKINSLYNTYLYKRLPPSPICNPGLVSIEAVLNPKSTNYWYYISGTDGKMRYARTVEEHQQNIRKYLK